MSNDTDIVEAIQKAMNGLGVDAEFTLADAFKIEIARNKALASRQTDAPEAGLVEELRARIDGLTQERDFHRETADLHAERLTALSRNHRDAVLEEAVNLIQRRVDDRFAEHGTREWDTNACYYEGPAGETYEALDEEAEEIIKAVRALKEPKP